MKILKYLLVCILFASFFSCNKNEDSVRIIDTELREDNSEDGQIIYMTMSGLENAPDDAAGDCSYGGACAVPPIMVQGIEEELIIEAIAEDLCLAKFTSLENGSLRMDLIASPDSHESYLRSIDAIRTKFNLGKDGRFNAATQALGISTKGVKKGVYRPRQQSSKRYWSGYVIFEPKDLL